MMKTCHQNALHKNYKKAGALLLLYFTNSCSRIIGLDYKPTCTFADADECFKDTNLLILGSSTSRHWFFALREVLQETGNRIGINGIDGRTDFVTVLSRVDCLLLLPVYSAGESPIEGGDSRALAEAIVRHSTQSPILVDIDSWLDCLPSHLEQDAIWLFQGAGSVGQLIDTFKAHAHQRVIE